MTLGIIFKRIRREWRLLAILLFAVSLITGFLALGPLYIRTVTEVDLRHALANADPDNLKVLVVGNTPLNQTSQDIIEDHLGPLVVGVERYKRASYSPPTVGANQNVGGISGTAVCGFNFTLGTSPFLGVGSTNHCYQPFAFENLADKVRVIEGRLPERGPTPQMVDPSGLSDEEQQARQIGVYSRGEVEAVVTRTVATTDNLEVGSRFFIGVFNLQGGGALSRVKIVGIVEPLDPQDSFWEANTMFLTGASVDIDALGNQRYDYGLAFDPVAFDEWVTPVLPQGVRVNYIWRLDVDTTVITSTNADSYAAEIENTANALSDGNNQVSVTTELAPILSSFENRTSSAQGPIILLSSAILVLMLYHLVTTVTLVLQQQSKEWSTITSRGGSTLQLFKLQSVSVAVLALVGFLSFPLFSRAFMFFMERIGPLKAALDGTDIGQVDFPLESYGLSLAAAMACIIVLSIPAIPASRRSLLLLKQATSRPPTHPAWSRYLLDLVFVGIGAAFLFRLYWTVSDKSKGFSVLLNDLIAKPAAVVKFVADRANETGGLKDPFNLLGPAMLLTGFALLWLRLFPLLMKAVARLASRSHRLTTPLAVWNVERDPAHYAQLVLLLIGTLALGTASLGLQTTRDRGGWKTAREETGGAARVNLNLTQGGYEDTGWDRLSGVLASTPILAYRGDARDDKSGKVNIIGVDPKDFAEAFPDFAPLLDGLPESVMTPVGIALREDAFELQVQVWSEEINVSEGVPQPTVVLNTYLQDAKGVPFRVQLQQVSLVGDASSVAGQGQATPPIDQPTPTRQWVTLRGRMPTTGTPPFRLWRVGIATRQGEAALIEHTVYLDYWQTVDASGTASLIASQEDPTLWNLDGVATTAYPGSWQNATLDSRQIGGIERFEFATSADAPVFDGQTALRIDYRIQSVVSRNEPSIGVNTGRIDRIPAIVSNDFAAYFKDSPSTSSKSPPLRVGQTRDITIEAGTGRINYGLQVINIIDSFPTLNESREGRYFLILPLDAVRALANQLLLNQGTPGRFADVNQVWLELEERKPTARLKAELSQLPWVGSSIFAWERYGDILREPLPSAVAGILFAGFWVSFALSLLDFAFYIAVTAKQRSFTFGVLRSLGWDASNIWLMLFVEQVTLVTPALVVGSILGVGLAYLLLPFLSLVGSSTLRMPFLSLFGLLATLIAGFTILLILAAFWLRRVSVNQVLRLGEE